MEPDQPHAIDLGVPRLVGSGDVADRWVVALGGVRAVRNPMRRLIMRPDSRASVGNFGVHDSL